MKRIKRIVIVGVGIFALAIGLIILLSSGGKTNSPRFVPVTQPAVTPWGLTYYEWGANVLFPNGRMWLLAADTNYVKRATYLYDLNRRTILGEMVNSGLPPLLQNRDGSRILVGGPPPSSVLALHGVLSGLGRVFPSWAATAAHSPGSLWIVDTRDNSARRVFTGIYSRPWTPSPDFRYGYSVSAGKTKYLCDLEARRVTQPTVAGDPRGWWDSRTILVEDATNSLAVFDVVTHQKRSLLSRAQIEAFLDDHDLPVDRSGVAAFANWNGSEYDFYLGLESRMLSSPPGNSFLLKIDRAGPSLKLLYHDFEFQEMGVLDSNATHYLYPGKLTAGGGDGAVYLRNLSNSIVTTLVAPNNKGQFSFPRFFGDEVIYFRDRLLRRVKLDGTGDEPISAEPK